MTAVVSRLAFPARWRHAFAILGVCLPVPVSAMTGLSLPLPAVVERLAAGLVPWVETAGVQANEALARGAVGSIGIVLDEVESTSEAAQSADPDHVVAASARTRAERPDVEGVRVLPPSDRPAAAGDESPRGKAQPAAAPSPEPTAEEPDPGPAASDPPPTTTTPTEPAPTEPTTDSDPVAPVVETVEQTVDTGGKVIDDTTEAVENVTGVPVPNVPPLPGLGK